MNRSTRLSLRNTSILIGIVAVAAVALLATSTGQAQSASGAAGPYHVELRLGGEDVSGRLLSVAFEPNSNQVATSTRTDERGQPQVEKAPGQLQYGDIILRRAIDQDQSLSDWRQEVIDGKIARARRDGTISIVDSAGKPVATWSIKRAWPSAYSVSPITAGSKATPYERVRISFEDMQRR